MNPSRGKEESIKELFELELKKGEIGTLFMGYSAIILRTSNKVIAYDVSNLLGLGEIKELKELDLLIYTHGHRDHYDKRTTLSIFDKTGTYIVAESGVFSDLTGRIDPEKLIEAIPDEAIEVAGVKIRAVSGIHVGPINLYLIETNGIKIFHGGDSGYTPLKGLSSDIAFIPTGDPSPTASPKDALKMALDLKPKKIVPIHGSSSQHRNLESLVAKELPESKVVIVEEWKPLKIEI